jgi:NAD(P)-dependent dehydrogenase (short-subunit alcohol dehydrogenase family)
MPKNIVVIGFGPGNATAMAEKFGAEGFSVGLVGRNEARLAAGVSALKARGIAASAFPADAADPVAIRAAISGLRAELGPITVIHWNASGGDDVGDILTADSAAVRRVLITNGGFGDLSPETDEYVTTANAMGIALANAAKRKLAGLLAQRLKGDGVYVGEVTIYGTIKVTSTDSGSGIDPSIVADKFWDLYQSRGEVRARVS